GFVAPRRLADEEREVGGSPAVEDRLRRLLQRALAAPQLEPRLASCILHGRGELGALHEPGLVDDREDPPALLPTPRLDQVLAPGGMGKSVHSDDGIGGFAPHSAAWSRARVGLGGEARAPRDRATSSTVDARFVQIEAAPLNALD